jgi:hypothetical protein
MKFVNKTRMEALLTKKGLEVINNGEDDYITVSGESSDYRINYWSEHPDYIFGIDPKLNEFVETRGWSFEWQDAGTLNIYPSF